MKSSDDSEKKKKRVRAGALTPREGWRAAPVKKLQPKKQPGWKSRLTHLGLLEEEKKKATGSG